MGASVEAGAGSSVVALCRVGVSAAAMMTSPLFGRGGLARTSRWRSSPLSLSSSEPVPSSKVSASVLSASERIGSSEERRCRNVGEDARDRKEGGSEFGMLFGSRTSCGLEKSSS